MVMDRPSDPTPDELVEIGYVRGPKQAVITEALLRGEGIRYQLGSPRYDGRPVMVDPARAEDASARLAEVQARGKGSGESGWDPAAGTELGPGLDEPAAPWARSGWPYFWWNIRSYLAIVAVLVVGYGIYLVVR